MNVYTIKVIDNCVAKERQVLEKSTRISYPFTHPLNSPSGTDGPAPARRCAFTCKRDGPDPQPLGSAQPSEQEHLPQMKTRMGKKEDEGTKGRKEGRN